MSEDSLVDLILPLGTYGLFLELFIPTFCILCRAKKRKYYLLRLLLVFGLAGLLSLVPNIVLFVFPLNFLSVIVFIFFSLWFLYDEKLYAVFFTTFGAIGLQHFCSNIIFLWYYLFPENHVFTQFEVTSIQVSTMFFFYFLAFLLFFLSKKDIYRQRRTLIPLLISLVIFVVAYIFAGLVSKEFEWNYLYRLYASLCSLLCIILLFVYPMLEENIAAKKELQQQKDLLENMITLQAKQSEQSQETIDILNLKFHDLKHQLQYLKESNTAFDTKELSELEKDLDIYQDFAKTGNETLDIVLTQKGLLCSGKNIRLTYIIDGKSLSFIDKVDLISLFGNILDNAMEAVEKEKENYRIIKLPTTIQKGFLYLREENYCHEEVRFKNGLPVTNKKDKNYHGFGMSSIQHICEKYQGNLSVAFEDNIFSLTILIPLS